MVQYAGDTQFWSTAKQEPLPLHLLSILNQLLGIPIRLNTKMLFGISFLGKNVEVFIF